MTWATLTGISAQITAKDLKKIFGTDFYIGANREKTVSLGAVDSDAIDFSKIKAVISFGGKIPRVILISPPCSRQKKQAMFLYRLRCPLNA